MKRKHIKWLVALAAVVIGPVVIFRVAKRQIVSPIRQKWIDELRDLMSTLLSKCKTVLILRKGVGLLAKDETNEVLFSEILYLEQKLALMLNPRESDHQNLFKVVGWITDEVQHGVDNIIEFGSKLDEATCICQEVLKREWKRVKNGEA